MTLRFLALSLAAMVFGLTLQPLGQQAAAQAPQDGTPVEFTGRFDVIHIDRLDGRRADDRYFVRDEATGETFELQFDGRAPRHLRTGQRVTVRGRAKGRRIWVTDFAAEGNGSSGSADTTGDAFAAATDEHNAVVMLVNFTNANAAGSVATVASLMFTGSDSVANTYAESSYGQVSVPADTDGDGQADVFGPFNIPYSSSPCDFVSWGYAADAVAMDAGVDLSLYQHKVYVLPSACGWLGVASLGGGRAWIFDGTRGPTYTHEFGHNFWMHHASTDPENDGNINSEYGDLSDPMGYASGGWRR